MRDFTLAGVFACRVFIGTPAVAAADSQGAVAKAPVTVPDISGVWQVARYERSIRTVHGKMPPLKPEANEV